MKKASLISTVVVIICICQFFVVSGQSGQLYVNRVFNDVSGNPIFNPILNPFGVQWGASIASMYGGAITVGHTSVGGQEDILLRKVDTDGAVVFSITKNVAGTQNDYGIAVIENTTNGDIYVCGATDNGTTTDYDVIMYHYSNSGTLLDSATYDSGSNLNDVGLAIQIHPGTGDIIVGATTQNATNGYDYLVLRFDASLNMTGTGIYDYVSLNDVPLGIDFTGGGDILLIGASASSTLNWDYCVAEFDQTSLAVLGDTRSNITGIGFDQPLAFCKDASQNIYITGRASADGINYDIRTIKILSNLNTIAWSVQFDGAASKEDAGTTIALDQNGDVIVGGFTTLSNNLTEMIVRKLNGSTGSTIWEKTQPSANNSGNSLVKKIAVNSTNGNIYFLASELGLSNFKEALVGRMSNSGVKQWQRSITDLNNDIVPCDIDYSGGDLYVSSISDSILDHYVLSKYNELEFDTVRYFNSNGQAASKARELIIKFNPSVVNTAMIDNATGTGIIEFGRPQNFLTSPASTAFYTALDEYCMDCDVSMAKIFTQKTSDTISLSNTGQNVPIPQFWSTFIVQFPSSINILQAHNALKTIPDVVMYSHPNVFIYPLAAPPNDSLYPLQTNLHQTSPGPIADINVEGAWNIEPGGRSYVKCGLFDSGIHWKHKDWNYDGSNPGTSKVDGWDFFPNGNGQPLKSNMLLPDSSGHGTSIGGIINADRNNTSGIAGIAGGNRASGNPGIQLYSLNIIGFSIANCLNSIFETSRGGFYTPYGFPIHFSNNSWYAVTSEYLPSQLDALREQVHFAWRNNVTFIVSRGDNNASDEVLPATYDSTWVLSVGGTGTNGQYKDMTTEETWWAPSRGRGIDVAAPAVFNLVRSLYNTSNTYIQVNGTSGSAAHVSGIVGLLMSHLNDTSGLRTYKNLAPEDCEYIIDHTANQYPTYDTLVGYGLVNAENALKFVDKSKYHLLHFGTNNLTPHSIQKSLFALNDTIKLTEPYTKYYPQQTFAAGKYVVNTFYIYANVYHNLSINNDSIVHYWPRHSSCYLYNLPQGPNKLLNMHERESINFLSQSQAALQGFIYEVRDSLGTPVGWWPCDTTFSVLFASGGPKTVFEYSILAKNKNLVGLMENYVSQLEINLFPNPANKSQTIAFKTRYNSDCTIELYDIMGRFIKTIYKGKTTESETYITHNVENLQNSMYIYHITVDGITTSKKFIKD